MIDIAQNFAFLSAPMAFQGVNEKDEVFAGMSVAKVVSTLQTNVKTVRLLGVLILHSFSSPCIPW